MPTEPATADGAEQVTRCKLCDRVCGTGTFTDGTGARFCNGQHRKLFHRIKREFRVEAIR